MKITDVKTTLISVPFQRPEVWVWGKRTGISSVIVEITTDEGVTGIGEIAILPSVAVRTGLLRKPR